MIPDEIVDRVRSGADIVEVISEYVSLKRTGANYIGLCPFHTEKTPSFTVSPSKQIFHCFGCGAGGDVVGFLVKHDNYSFPEAVRKLADRAGIVIPETKGAHGRDRGELEALAKVNEEALSFFVRCLWETKEGERARSYLEGRGMTAAAREFQMGYSPPEWDGLLRHAGKKGFGTDTAVKAGLAIPRQSGQGFYDRFRDRVMFPIRDARGRAIGFGGRTMGDEQPKYLNSPETPLFRKGETLYLLDVASEHVRKRGYSVITEGYFDAIACHTAGVKNAVATLGTALTAAHLRLLSRFSKNVLLVFDSDAAGIKAAERSLDIFLGTDMTAKVALLPAGDDPDSLVRRDGPSALAERLKASEKLIDFVIKRAAGNVLDIEDKVAAAAVLTGILARMDNGVERAHYLRRSAEELGVPEGALAEELSKKLGKPGVYRGPSRQAASGGAHSRIEEELVHLILNHPDAAAEAAAELEPDDFGDPGLKAIAARVFELVEKEGEASTTKVLDSFPDEKAKSLVLRLSIGTGGFDDPMASARGSITRFKRRRIEARLAELTSRMREAEENKDFALLNKLQKEFAEWQKRKS